MNLLQEMLSEALSTNKWSNDKLYNKCVKLYDYIIENKLLDKIKFVGDIKECIKLIVVNELTKLENEFPEIDLEIPYKKIFNISSNNNQSIEAITLWYNAFISNGIIAKFISEVPNNRIYRINEGIGRNVCEIVIHDFEKLNDICTKYKSYISDIDEYKNSDLKIIIFKPLKI